MISMRFTLLALFLIVQSAAAGMTQDQNFIMQAITRGQMPQDEFTLDSFWEAGENSTANNIDPLDRWSVEVMAAGQKFQLQVWKSTHMSKKQRKPAKTMGYDNAFQEYKEIGLAVPMDKKSQEYHLFTVNFLKALSEAAQGSKAMRQAAAQQLTVAPQGSAQVPLTFEGIESAIFNIENHVEVITWLLSKKTGANSNMSTPVPTK